MLIAATGAAGFIGSHLCERLIRDAHEVVGLDNFDDFYDRTLKDANLARLRDEDNFTFIEADIRNPQAMLAAFDGCDAIVHLAARAGVRPSFERPALYADVNVHGTAVVLEAIRSLKIPTIVFASSSSVYGEGTEVPFREDQPLGTPASPYATTKVAGEGLCKNFAAHIPNISVLRFFTAYGPRQRPDLAVRKFTELILSGQPIPVFGDTDSFRDYTYIDDIIDGVVSALERSDGYATYNLGSGRPVKLGEMITALEKSLNRTATRLQLPPQEGDLIGTWADTAKARDRLGYVPHWTVEEGMRSFVEWLDGSRSS